ncbi:MAG: glycosyltransferase family 2 protein [Candidatus Dormibacterales bacterium]
MTRGLHVAGADAGALAGDALGVVRGRPRVSVVIPTLNEADNLQFVLPLLPPEVDEVVVVDGRSTDRTVATARALRPDAIIVEQSGTGKGDALAAGFRAAAGNVVVTLDADGSTDPREIPRFIAALDQGADVAKGSRFCRGGGSRDITRLRAAGNLALTSVVNLVFGTRYTDLCYGFNAYRAHRLPDLNVDCAGFEVETLINVRAAKAGLRVIEVPSLERSRVFGVSNLNAFRDGWRVLRTIWREATAGSGAARRAATSRTRTLPL